MPYITEDSLRVSLGKVHGTADHMLKIWLVLKQMGMANDQSVEIDTRSPTRALQRLFSYGDPERIPGAASERYVRSSGSLATRTTSTRVRMTHSYHLTWSGAERI